MSNRRCATSDRVNTLFWNFVLKKDFIKLILIIRWCKKPSGVLYISRTYQPKCSSSLEEQAGLCYGWCKDGFKGIGLLCWSKCEGRTDYPADCGMYCGENGPYCDVRNINIILTLGASIGSVVTNPTLSSGIEQINSITNQVSGHEVCKVQV